MYPGSPPELFSIDTQQACEVGHYYQGGGRGPLSCLVLILKRGLLARVLLKMPHPIQELGLVLLDILPFFSFDLQTSVLGVQSCRAVLCSWKSGSTCGLSAPPHSILLPGSLSQGVFIRIT